MAFWQFALWVFSTAISYTKARKAKKAAERAADAAAGVLVNQETTDANIPVVYGRRRVGGVKRVLGSVDVSGGDKNEYIYIALLVAEGEVNSITDIELDEVSISNSKFSGLYTVETHLGADNQAASTVLQEISNWTSDHKFSGIAYIALKLKWDQSVFSGPPDITAIVEGRKVFDPRDGSTAHSTNPALCIRDYMTNARYGKGIPATRIDDTAFSAAANDFDDTVEYYTNGETGKLYEINAVLDTGSEIFDNLDILLTGCRGFLPRTNGQYALYMDKAQSSAMSLDTSQIVDGIKIVGEKTSNRYNQVRVTFVNPENNWQNEQAVWPPKDSTDETTFLSEDNAELILDIQMPTCTNYYAALDFARVLCLRSRNAKRVAFKATSEALSLAVPDVVSITHPTPGFVAKPFQIESIGLESDGTCVISGVEYDSSIYAYDNTVEQVTYADTVLPDPSVVAPVSNLTAVGATQSEADGSVISAIDTSFNAPLDSFVESYEITYTGSDDSEIIIPWLTTTHRQTNLNSAITYTVSVRAKNNIGARSAAVSVSGVAPSEDTTAPGAPTGLTVNGTFKQIDLSWTNPTDKDFNHVEIKRSSTNVEGDAVYLDRTSAGSYSDSGYVQQVTRYYWVRAVDRSGNASAWVAGGGGTSLALVANDFDAGVIAPSFLTTDLQSTITSKASQDSVDLILDEAQDTGNTLDTIATRMLTLATTQDDTLGLISDAGITVDPNTGAVTLQSVESLRTSLESQLNTVSVDLNAAEAEITLKASTAYVNNSIAEAVLDSSDLASLNELEVKVNEARVDIDGNTAQISVKANSTTVDDMEVRLTQARADIDGNTADISIMAKDVDLSELEARVLLAETDISALDVPSITQTVIDSRTLKRELDQSAITSLDSLLAAYNDQQEIRTDLAFAQSGMSAHVNDLREATATDKAELGVLIDENKASILSEATARVDADSAITTSVNTLTSNLSTTDSNVSGNATAISGLETRVEDAEGDITSQASDITSLTSTVGSNTTAISTQTTTINGITAQHSVTIDSNGHVSGYGLVSDIIDGNATSAFVVAADQFAIGGANNVTGTYPFVHYANATTVTVDGATFTIPAGTYIDNAKINFLSAEDIITGSLSAQRIDVDGQTLEADGDSLKIKNLGVDTLQIANQAITIPRSDTTASTIYLSDQVWTSLADLTFAPASVNGVAQPVSVKAFIPFTAFDSSNNVSWGTLFVRFKKNNAVILGPQEISRLELYAISTFAGSTFITIDAPFGTVAGNSSPFYLDTDTSTAQRTYKVEVMWDEYRSGGNGFRISAGAVLECIETKR